VGFRIARAGHAVLDCFDVTGRRVARLWEEWTDAGEHEVGWERERLPAGVYFLRLRAGDSQRTLKVLKVG
jgi:hypothetical protein